MSPITIQTGKGQKMKKILERYSRSTNLNFITLLNKNQVIHVISKHYFHKFNYIGNN